MKKLLFVLAMVSSLAFAEATFEQIEGLIQQKNYQAAEQGLEVIIKNHPQSAKAFYAMAQAQAGLGNLEKAQKALNIATGLNPTLDFAPASSVQSLKEAITPQTKKIEAVEESHFWRNFAYFVMFALFSWACYFMWCVYNRKKDEEEGSGHAGSSTPPTPAPSSPSGFTDTNRETSRSYASSYTPRPAYQGTTRTVTPAPAPTTTVINNTTSNSSNDLLTGVLIGDMLSNHHHETTRVVEREVIREVPAPSRSSSWDDDSSSRSSSSSSRSSSWDDDSSSSSKKSSSWDSSSDSSSSSSWSDSSSSSSSSSDW